MLQLRISIGQDSLTSQRAESRLEGYAYTEDGATKSHVKREPATVVVVIHVPIA